MEVFVAGATVAIGRPVAQALRAHGHAVAGLTRDPGKREILQSLGAEAFVADALDAEGLARALVHSRATHVVQLLTALPPEGPLRARDLAATNALRTRGTANVLEAAVAAGARAPGGGVVHGCVRRGGLRPGPGRGRAPGGRARGGTVSLHRQEPSRP